jgi:hypothetical protein
MKLQRGASRMATSQAARRWLRLVACAGTLAPPATAWTTDMPHHDHWLGWPTSHQSDIAPTLPICSLLCEPTSQASLLPHVSYIQIHKSRRDELACPLANRIRLGPECQDCLLPPRVELVAPAAELAGWSAPTCARFPRACAPVSSPLSLTRGTHTSGPSSPDQTQAKVAVADSAQQNTKIHALLVTTSVTNSDRSSPLQNRSSPYKTTAPWDPGHSHTSD